MRSPARVASLSRDSGARSDIKAGVSMISVSANAAGAANAMDRPRQAEPSVSHLNLLAIQIAFTLVRSESCRRGPEPARSEEHTSELQSRPHLVCRLLLEKKNNRS